MSKENLWHNVEDIQTQEVKKIWKYIPAKSENEKNTKDTKDHDADLERKLAQLKDPEQRKPQEVWPKKNDINDIYTAQFAELQSQNPDFWNKRKTSYDNVTALIPNTGFLSYLAS